MSANNGIRQPRPHFDERHEHNGRICDPKRRIITEPIVGLGVAAVDAYKDRSDSPSKRFINKLLNAYDDNLEVIESGVFVYKYGILGFMELHMNQRFTVGDISRGARIPGDYVNPVVKSLWWGGELSLEPSECQDATTNDESGVIRINPESGEPIRPDLVYINHIGGHRKKTPYSISFQIPRIIRPVISLTD